MNKFQLRGRNLDDLKAQIVAEHGPLARIVGAEKVTQGGIGGFLARRYFEVTVEVPRKAAARHVQIDPADRIGLASLLDDADAAEGGAHDAFPQLELSTNAVGFEAVVADLTTRAGLRPRGTAREAAPAAGDGATGRAGAPLWPENFGTPATRLGPNESGAAGTTTPTTPPPATSVPTPGSATGSPLPRTTPGRRAFTLAADDLLTPGTRFPLIPAPTRAPGDLTLIVGLGNDALTVARGMAGEGGAVHLRAGGSLGFEHSDSVRDRRSAMTARAEAVHRERAVFVAYGLDPTADFAEILRSIGADQVWAAVDAGRKHEDTERWLRALTDAVGVSALAVIGSHKTATPETVNRLGVPIGWLEDLSATHRES